MNNFMSGWVSKVVKCSDIPEATATFDADANLAAW